VPTGSWPPSAAGDASAGPIVPSGTWPPSARDQEAEAAPAEPDEPDLGFPETGEHQLARPLWPSSWPSSGGGAYSEQPETPAGAGMRRRRAAGQTPSVNGQDDHGDHGDDDEGGDPQDPATRFW
jgi:hypothetical protein